MLYDRKVRAAVHPRLYFLLAGRLTNSLDYSPWELADRVSLSIEMSRFHFRLSVQRSIISHGMTTASSSLIPNHFYPILQPPSIMRVESFRWLCSHWMTCKYIPRCRANTLSNSARYTPNKRTAWREKKSVMTRVNVELTSFYNNLPSILRLPSAPSKQPVPPHIYCLQ